MKRKKGEEGKAPSIFRCDKLPTHMKSGKIRTLKAMLQAWRRSAKVISDLQWNCFFQQGKFDSFFDPATVHRKQGAEVRTGLLRQIGGYFGVEPIVFEKKRLPKMIPGLVDALEPLKAVLGAAEVQMVREQVLGTLNSYISNRQNDFRQAVFSSCLSNEEHETTRHALLVINKAKAWFTLKREVQIDGTPIDMRTRKLARNIMSQIMSRHRKPRFNRIGMVVDQRIATLSISTSGTSFDIWLKLRIAGLRETRKAAGQKNPDGFLHIPVRTYDRFNARQGERKQSFQIIEDRHTGEITVGVVSDVGEMFQATRDAYAANANGPLALDFGLKTMFATNEGDLLGRDFLRKLKALDETLSGIARHVQRSGQKPRSSKRYVQHAERTRGYIKTELNRIINKLIATKRPSRLFWNA